MEAALFIAIFSSFIGFFAPSAKQVKVARDRRMAEHRMNARLLRLDI
ncbi:MAG TPA: hypothetical protein VGN17_31350 [Bryobacteraceae bacterium]|jgi:hypothetical protein